MEAAAAIKETAKQAKLAANRAKRGEQTPLQQPAFTSPFGMPSTAFRNSPMGIGSPVGGFPLVLTHPYGLSPCFTPTWAPSQ